jgi:hypothetical protein
MKMSRWFWIAFIVLFLVPYCVAFVPMLLEGVAQMFGTSLVSECLMDTIHMAAFCQLVGEVALGMIAIMMAAIIGAFTESSTEG